MERIPFRSTDTPLKKLRILKKYALLMKQKALVFQYQESIPVRQNTGISPFRSARIREFFLSGPPEYGWMPSQSHPDAIHTSSNMCVIFLPGFSLPGEN